MSELLRWATATETRSLILRGEVTARAVIEACLGRVEALNPVLHAFIRVDREGALLAAERADQALARGEQAGPLFGVPVAVKDDLWVKDLPATCGSLLFAKFRPSCDGTVTERLRAAGAIILGKTNMPEFAAWPRSKSWLAHEAVNAWDPTRIAGASSGGSAAAVASGMVPIAIGTDGGGSTRIPSALNGLVGLFPTLGRVPGHGSFCYSPFASAGPIARTVADAALVQSVIAGPDPRALTARIDPAPDVLSRLDAGLAGTRLGWSSDFGWIPVSREVAELTSEVAASLGSIGATVEEVPEAILHPWGVESCMEGWHRCVAEAGDPSRPDQEPPEVAGVEDWVGQGADRGILMYQEPQFRALFATNEALLSPPQQALASGAVDIEQPLLGSLAEDFLRLLQRYDFICSPTMATVAPLAPAGWRSAYADSFMGTHFTFIANVAGCPAVTVPCGLVGGLPVGVQFIGRPGDESGVLSAAKALESLWPAPRLST